MTGSCRGFQSTSGSSVSDSGWITRGMNPESGYFPVGHYYASQSQEKSCCITGYSPRCRQVTRRRFCSHVARVRLSECVWRQKRVFWPHLSFSNICAQQFAVTAFIHYCTVTTAQLKAGAATMAELGGPWDLSPQPPMTITMSNVVGTIQADSFLRRRTPVLEMPPDGQAEMPNNLPSQSSAVAQAHSFLR